MSIETMKLALEAIKDLQGYRPDIDTAIETLCAALSQPTATPKPSPTHGMNLGERIKHVGGRENAQGYIEFGSVMAVRALIKQVIRDMQPATTEPVAALVRHRRLRTQADCAFDKKDHYSDWSDWEPTTLSYALAVTDPARDRGLLPLYEMMPLYTHPVPSVPATTDPVGEIKWAANVPNSIREVVFYDLMPPIGTKLYTRPAPSAPATPAPLTGCNCRWQGGTQVEWCELHLAHKDAIHEWAQRAKAAEAALKATPEPVAPIGYIPTDAIDQIKTPPRLITRNIPVLSYAAEGHTAIYTHPAQSVPGIDECTHERVADLLYSIGWRNPCDAQWTGLKAALPELAAMLAARTTTPQPKEPS